MEIPKDKILEMLKTRARATRPARPSGSSQTRSTRSAPRLLAKFGLEPQDLIKKFAGGGIPGL